MQLPPLYPAHLVETYAVPVDAINHVVTYYYAQLTHNVRFNHYRMSETLEEWFTLLGPEVLFLTHPLATAQTAAALVAYHHQHQLAPLDGHQLVTAAYIHDWGELILPEIGGVGDISFDQKTITQESMERRVFSRVLAPLPAPVQDELLTIYQNVVVDHTSELFQPFNIVERLGYLHVALRAYHGRDGQRIGNWQGLIGNVLSNQIPHLLVYAQTEPFVSQLLQKEKPSLTTMFGDLRGQPIPPDNTGRPCFEADKLATADIAWSAYLKYGVESLV